MDIRHFTLQDWIEKDLLIMKYIKTTDNSADALTKATGGQRILYYPLVLHNHFTQDSFCSSEHREVLHVHTRGFVL